MKSEDYFVNAMLALAVVIIIIVIAYQADKIDDLKEDVKDLQHRIDLIETYHFNHSSIK